jgi:hypothetical protein
MATKDAVKKPTIKKATPQIVAAKRGGRSAGRAATSSTASPNTGT